VFPRCDCPGGIYERKHEEPIVQAVRELCEAEDMRQFILDGGLWLLRDPDITDLIRDLLTREATL
jgi:hypothetical protein